MSLLISSQQDELERLIEGLSQLTTYSIGRLPDNAISIPNGKISSKHAQLIQCTADSYVLVDLDSKNGTFVNGARIARKVIGKQDTIRLADVDYTLDQLLALLKRDVPKPTKNEIPKNVPTAEKNALLFTKEFTHLQQVQEQYPKLKRDCRNREKMIRTGSVILSSVVGVGAAVLTGGGALPVIHILSSAGLSVLIPTLCSTLLSTEEKLEVIEKEYREKYRCPNPACRDSFVGREWEALAQQKTCRRCQAVWVH